MKEVVEETVRLEEQIKMKEERIIEIKSVISEEKHKNKQEMDTQKAELGNEKINEIKMNNLEIEIKDNNLSNDDDYYTM